MALLSTMHAVLLKGHGGFEHLEYRENVPVPHPKTGEVLIRVAAAAVNNTDINTRIGWYSKAVTEGTAATHAAGATTTTGTMTAAGVPEDGAWTGTALRFPRIQGTDACGHIVAVGADVSPGRIGERVLIDPVLRPRGGPAGYFASECDGAFAQYACAPADNAHRIESALSDVELASFPCSYSTAENLLHRAHVGAGMRVLVTGASGGVGSAAVQLAHRRGARVVAVASPSKAPMLEALGASEVVARDADLETSCGSASIDVVIDVVGGPAFAGLLEVLRPGGRYAVSGAIAGPLVTLDLRTLYLKDLTLIGGTIQDAEVFPALVRYIERGEIRPVVAAVFPLRAIVEAQRLFLEKRHVGKIVLTIEE
jgi:NADPH:quinone reductase-like Zn-dependent oxidoreductase